MATVSTSVVLAGRKSLADRDRMATSSYHPLHTGTRNMLHVLPWFYQRSRTTRVLSLNAAAQYCADHIPCMGNIAQYADMYWVGQKGHIPNFNCNIHLQ